MALVSRFLARVARTTGVLAAGLALAGLAQAQLSYFTATLNGGQEVPPTPSTGTGVGCFVFDASTNIISYNITYAGLTSAETAAHLHQAAAGVNGPVIVPLPLGTPKTGSAPLTAAQAAALMAGNVYTNIHTQAFPGGEIRGQLVLTPATTAFCFGDGSSGPCPCGNNSTPGNNQGCLHSGGVGGKLVASGATSLACDSLQLCASNLLGSNSIFIQGSTSPIAPVPFGDGLRCIGGTLKRLGIFGINGGNVCVGGAGTVAIHTAGGITAPGSYGYQVYFRDPAAYCTAFTYDITNAIQATWVP